MTPILRPMLAAAAVIVVACGAASIGIGGAGGGMAVGTGSYQKEIDDWHRARVERLKKDDGWLSLVGLFPLPEGLHTFGAAADNELTFPEHAPAHAGTIAIVNGKARLRMAEGVSATHDGQPVQSIDLASDADGDPTEIQVGTIKFYVIERSPGLFLRVKDSQSPLRKEFHGIDRYPVDRRWRIEARFEPYDPPKMLTVANAQGYKDIVECAGALVFEYDGTEYRLEPVSEFEGEMEFAFADATTGHETYGGGREIDVPRPDAEGKTTIDFNKAYNPPCVFTPYATCPLPHDILPFKVEAGEKNWDRH